jgi:hypothetical protein
MRRVKTTVERQIAGVASSKPGEETDLSAWMRPVSRDRRSTSHPDARQRRRTATTRPTASGPSETSHGRVDDGSGASRTAPPGERTCSTYLPLSSAADQADQPP